MLNYKIGINEVSKLLKRNFQRTSIKKCPKDGVIYSIKQSKKIKKLIFSIIISIIYIKCYIITSNKYPLFENIEFHSKEGIRIYKRTGKLSFNKLEEITFKKK